MGRSHEPHLPTQPAFQKLVLVDGSDHTNSTLTTRLYNVTAIATNEFGQDSITWLWNIYSPAVGEAVREFVQVIII